MARSRPRPWKGLPSQEPTPARSVPGRRKPLIQPATAPSKVNTSTMASTRAIASSA